MEKELKYDIRKLSPKEQEELRKKIVRKMEKHGNTKEVAEICECSLRHVQSTWKKYQFGGVKAIEAVKMGSPVEKHRKLTLPQESEMKELLTKKRPCDFGLSGYLWGRTEVSELIKQQYDIEMPLSTTGDYLARWNFTSQRPKKRITDKTSHR